MYLINLNFNWMLGIRKGQIWEEISSPQLRNHLGGSCSQLGHLLHYYSLHVTTTTTKTTKSEGFFFSCDKQRQKLHFGLSMIPVFYVVTKVKHLTWTRNNLISLSRIQNISTFIFICVGAAVSSTVGNRSRILLGVVL